MVEHKLTNKIWSFKVFSDQFFIDFSKKKDQNVLLRGIMYLNNKHAQTTIKTTNCEQTL